MESLYEPIYYEVADDFHMSMNVYDSWMEILSQPSTPVLKFYGVKSRFRPSKSSWMYSQFQALSLLGETP